MSRVPRLAALVVAILAASSVAQANFALIQEVEKLRNTISASDRSRPQLTLRLADLYFDEATRLSSNPSATADDEARAASHRRKAVSLYRESTTGADGLYAPASGSLKIKIEFQLARLHADLGEKDLAKKYWLSLVSQGELSNLKREAALRLGELEDENSDKYYQIAIDLCAASDVCSYAHYRRSWLYKNRGELTRAIDEIQLALYDSKAQIREEALRDLITFMGGEPGSAVAAIEKIDAFATKHSRPELLESLARSYYAAGHREAGTRVLDFVNRRKPLLDFQIQLLEEYYSQRNWDRFNELLPEAKGNGMSPLRDPVESEKILRRLAIQLDGVRVSQPERAPEFKQTALLYLSLFPKSPERMKLIEGWTAAESDASAKVTQLKAWIDDSTMALAAADIARLRELRASIAQKSGNHAVVAEEMAVMADAARAQPKQAARAREYDYLRARALYELKNYGAALPIFQSLAAQTSSPDQWAIQSQNLALDILSINKDFAGIAKQSALWTDNAQLQKDPKLAGELREMRDVSEQAAFEGAVAAGQTAQALATFRTFCESKKLLPKSCDNAKVLAVKLADEQALISVLRVQGNQAELAAELEAAGYFAEAASILETIDLKSSPQQTTPYLRIAFLYELGRKTADRDRILRRLITLPSVVKAMGTDEPVILATLREAGMLTRDNLRLGWSAPVRASLAHDLEAQGLGNAETAKIVLTSETDLGPAWTRAILAVLAKVDQEQAKIKFYGKNSKRQFERRMDAIQKLAVQADAYLVKSSAASRVRIAAMLSRSYSDFAAEILASPIPPELEAEAIETVKASLAQMAAPFSEKSAAYSKIATEQLARVEPASARAELEPLLTSTAPTSDIITVRMASATRSSVSLDEARVSRSLSALNGNPSDIGALRELQAAYEAGGSPRLASYFRGRIADLEKRGEAK